MPNVNPVNPDEQLGESSNRWAEVHGYALNTAAVRLDRLTPFSPRYNEFAAANSRYLHQRKDGILYLGNAQIAYFTDFEGTRDIVQRFLAEEAGTGVNSEHPHIPATYDTLFSIANALVELDAYRVTTDARLASLEGEGGCCDVALAELTDVSVTAPGDGHVLVYDDSTDMWVNRPRAAIDNGAIGGEAVLQAASELRDGSFMSSPFKFTYATDSLHYGLIPIATEGTVLDPETGETMRPVTIGEALNPFSTAYFSSSVLHVADASVPLGVTYTESPTWTLISSPAPGAAQATAQLSRAPLEYNNGVMDVLINITLTVNGLAQQLGKDYLVDGLTLLWISTQFDLEANDVISVTYTGA